MIILLLATMSITVLEKEETSTMDPKNNRLVLTVLSAICVVLIGVTSIKNTWLAPLRAGVGFILTPIQVGVNTAGKSLYNSIEQHEKLKSALEDNSKLQEKIEELRSENTRLEEATYELSRLRELYKLNTEYEKYNFVGARIIAKDSSGWFRVFRIDKGSADGIKVDMNVLASGGLVGIVTDVGSNYATVRSIIDDLSRVSAMAVQSGDNCIVAGDLKLYQEGKLKLSDIRANADIKDGDKIVTSNISTKYVPGLLVGYATDITEDRSRWTKSGYIVPAASCDTMQEVLIITDVKKTQDE